MKKLLVTSALFIGLISSSFASGNDAYHFSGAKSFKKAFPEAANISVKSVEQLTKISFTSNNESYEVFYSAEGELIVKSKHIKMNELPAGSAESIIKKYSEWTIAEAIKFENEAEGETHYYVSLDNGNKHMIVEANADGSTSIYKR